VGGPLDRPRAVLSAEKWYATPCGDDDPARRLHYREETLIEEKHMIYSTLTPESIPNSVIRMRTTLDLPEDLVNEAKAMLGYKSKTDVIVFALKELLRRKKVEELIEMFGHVEIDIDIPKSRRRPAARAE
jgi:hypothetical protein